MKKTTVYELLNSEDEAYELKKARLIAFIKNKVDNLPTSDVDRRKIAYSIAGLMSTDFVRSLGNEATLNEIIELAGELEIEDSGNDEKWSLVTDLSSRL